MFSRNDRNVLNSRTREAKLRKNSQMIDKQRAVKMKNAKIVKCFSGSIKSHLNQVFSYSNNRNCFLCSSSYNAKKPLVEK